MDDSIVSRLVSYLTPGAGAAVPQQSRRMPPAVGTDFTQLQPTSAPAGRLKYHQLPRLVNFSPMENKQIMDWERGETNHAELTRAIDAERDPKARQLLIDEYQNLFGGAAQ